MDTAQHQRANPVLASLTLAACVAIVIYKAVLVTRININWDEFWYLSFVHALSRGELTLLVQGAFTHLFAWLPNISGNEIDQIVAARLVMVALLGITAGLVWLLGRRWLDGFAAAVPPIVYLTLVPVTIHGGSFRADSMLAPLLMGALVLLTRRPGDARNEVFAGVLLGLAGAVTVKVVLFAPLIGLLVIAVAVHDKTCAEGTQGLAIVRSIIRTGSAAAVVGLTLIAVHAWSLSDATAGVPGMVPPESVTEFASRTASTTLLDSRLSARVRLVETYAAVQPLPWLLLVFGLVAGVLRRRYDVATLVLALLPVAVYRNSYPYFYVVMIAPASVLAGFAVQSIMAGLSGELRGHVRDALAITLWLGLMYPCVAYLGRLLQDNQAVQRQIVAGVHEIFPAPVNYMDRCGMIASFRKVNFFMSAWGMRSYRAQGRPFIPEVLRSARPAFVIFNSQALVTSRSRANGLLDVDRELLQRFYPQYWGPVGVAGAVAWLQPGVPQLVELPYPAQYRIESNSPLLVDGTLRAPGDVVDIAQYVTVEGPTGDAAATGRVIVRFVLALAGPRPAREPDPEPIFQGL
jgi:hypothetical protein